MYMYAVGVVLYPVLTEDRSSCLAEEVLPADTIGARSRRRKRLKLPIILDSPIPTCRSYDARRSWQLRAAVHKPHRSIPDTSTATPDKLRTP